MSLTSQFTAQTLQNLPPPNVLETLDYDATLALLVANAKQYMLDNGKEWDLQITDPAYKVLAVNAYIAQLEVNKRNEACRAVMPLFSTGADLDNIVARNRLVRLEFETNDDEVNEKESDASLLRRYLLSDEGLSCSGSVGTYVFHGLSASALVKDIAPTTPQPCIANVYLLSHVGNGVPTSTLITTVYDYLMQQFNSHLGDDLTVIAADVIDYALDATITFLPGIDSTLAMQQVQNSWAQFKKDSHALGADITQSAVDAALHQAGVHEVIINSPSLPIRRTESQAAFCTGETLTDGGIDE